MIGLVEVVRCVCRDVLLHRDIVMEYRREKISFDTMVERIAELYHDVVGVE